MGQEEWTGAIPSRSLLDTANGQKQIPLEAKKKAGSASRKALLNSSFPGCFLMEHPLSEQAQSPN